MGYTKATIRGIGWMGMLQLCIRVITLVKIVVVAKLLSPHDIGSFAIVTTVLSLAEIFTETGIQTFLIQNNLHLKKVIGTAWFIIFLRGMALFIIMLLLSFPVAVFFNVVSLTPLIAVASFIPVVKALENPYIITFQKNLHFKLEFVYRFFVVLCDFVFSVTLVLLLHTATGLVLGLLISISIGVVLSWLLLKERPRLQVNKQMFRQIGKFTKSIIPLNIANYLVNQSDAILIGKLAGVGALGIYQVSQKFSSQPLIEISDIFGKVTYPIYSKIAYDKKRLLSAYKKILCILAFSCVFVAFLLFFFTHYLIAFLGSSWKGADFIYPILLAYGLILSLWGSIGSLLFSIGGQRLLARLAIIRLFITLPLLGMGIFYFGLLGAAWALLISIIIIQPVTLYYLFKTFARHNHLRS